MKEKKEKKRREVLAGGERERQTERDHLSSIMSAKVLKSLRLPGLSGILTGICHCKSTDKSTADEFAVSKFAIYNFAVKTYAARWELWTKQCPPGYTGLPLLNQVFSLLFVVVAMVLS